MSWSSRILILPHRLRSWTWLTWDSVGGPHGVSLIIRIWRLMRQLRIRNVGEPSTPIVATAHRWWGRRRVSLVVLGRPGDAPLHTGRTADARLIRLRMNILWSRCRVTHVARRLTTLQKLQSSFYMDVRRIEFRCPLIGIQRVIRLIIARLVQRSKVVPNFGNVWVKTYRAGVRIQSVPVLVNLVVKHTNGTPKCRVPAVAIDSLLVCLIRFRVL